MTTYSGYNDGPSVLTWFVGMCILGIVGLGIAGMLMGTAGIMQAGTPRQTPGPNRIGGIDIDDAVEEARSVIRDLVPGGEVGYLTRSTGGLLRVCIGREGALFIVGHNDAPSLLAAAEKIAERLGATVGLW